MFIHTENRMINLNLYSDIIICPKNPYDPDNSVYTIQALEPDYHEEQRRSATLMEGTYEECQDIFQELTHTYASKSITRAIENYRDEKKSPPVTESLDKLSRFVKEVNNES